MAGKEAFRLAALRSIILDYLWMVSVWPTWAHLVLDIVALLIGCPTLLVGGRAVATERERGVLRDHVVVHLLPAEGVGASNALTRTSEPTTAMNE